MTVELRAVTPTWKGDTLSDGDGLSGEVRVAADSAVSVRFKYAFRWSGKVAWHQCGTWPSNSMEAIRAQRDRAREQVSKGVNPNDQKRADRIEAQAAVAATIEQAERTRTENLTAQDLFDTWIVDGVNRKDGNKELKRIFERDILPVIGGQPVRQLTEANIRAVLRPVITAGNIRKAQVLLLGIKQMMAWAEKRQPWRAMLIEANPADLISEDSITPPDYDDERDRVLSAAEIKELATIFVDTTADYENAPAGTKYEHDRPLKKESQIAVWICLATLSRIGELLMAEWRHIDFEAGTWLIPKENVKGRRKKKQDLRVDLSPFALRQFDALRALTGDAKWCFPARDKDSHVGVRTVAKQIGDRQERFMDRKPLKNRQHNNTLVLADGANGNWTPHDMRRTGATMMQQLGIVPDIIDRCQNHVMPGGKVRRHYLHHDFAQEKREAWITLGNRLDAILTDNVIVLPAREATA